MDRYRQQRLWQQPGLDERRPRLAGQGVGGFSRCQLRHQDKITGDCVRLRPGFIAERRGERTDPLIVAVMIRMRVDMVRCELLQMPADVQWSVGAERAGEDPDQGLSAGERVARGAYHFGDQRPLRIDTSPGRMAPPLGLKTLGSGDDAGDGNPCSNSSYSPSMPMPVGACAGMIGKKRAVATAARRSGKTMSKSICSPLRCRSSSVSSSDSSMIDSISGSQYSSMISASVSSGSRETGSPLR